ncbi:MAG: hypothetical protein KH120_04685 [Eubacterium sp.]|nr:hypothetical protein [Eubacterium sp.]
MAKKRDNDSVEATSWEWQPKTVTLTNRLWHILQFYILSDTYHRKEKLKMWEELAHETDENGEPKFKNAVSNAEFLRDMELQLQQILKALD